jgi:hypothetical protein
MGLPWPIAGVSNGIVHTPSLDLVWERYHDLFRRKDITGYGVDQSEFGMAFSSVKLPITDWCHKFKSPYWDSHLEELREYAQDQNEYLIVPYQMLRDLNNE